MRLAGGLGERMCVVDEKVSGAQGKRVKVIHFLGFSRRTSATEQVFCYGWWQEEVFKPDSVKSLKKSWSEGLEFFF